MLAKCYADLRIIDFGDKGQVYIGMGQLQFILHGVFTANGGKYAVAFPKSKHGSYRSLGDVARVFAESEADLYALYSALKGHSFIKNYVNVGLPQDVPTGFKGKWYVWRRIRVKKSLNRNREASVQQAMENPYCNFRSVSNGHDFQMRYLREEADPQREAFTPTSYGLATAEHKFSLPDLPL